MTIIRKAFFKQNNIKPKTTETKRVIFYDTFIHSVHEILNTDVSCIIHENVYFVVLAPITAIWCLYTDLHTRNCER